MVLEKATSAGVIQPDHKERTTRLLNSMKTRGDADKKGLPALDAEAAKNPAGQLDVKLGEVNTKVKGFGTYTGAKGKDGGNVKTKPETLVDIYWMFDASPVFGAKKGTWQIGPGFEYWDNKFGDPTYKTVAAANAATASTGVFTSVNPQVSCFMLALEYHF